MKVCDKVSGHLTIRLARDKDIQKGDRAIFLFFPGELDARVYCVEAVIEVCQGVGIGATPEALTTILDNTVDVIHVDRDEAGDRGALFPGYFDGPFHGVNHPQLADSDHEGQANGA